jgi:hypothetical protein
MHPTAAPALVVGVMVGVVVAAAGCASTVTPPIASQTAPSAAATAASAAASTSTDPASLALHDAAALVSSFAPPPGATRSPSKPTGTPSALDSMPVQQQVSTKAVSTGWWLVPMSADAADAWLRAHGADGWGAVGPTATAVRFITYTKPSTATLAERTVTVSVAPLSAQRAVLRVDAEDVYRLSKPAAEAVPATAYLLATVQPVGGVAAPEADARILTVTDRATIAKLAGLINALPREVDSVHSCPIDRGGKIVLAFKDSANGAARATVVIGLSGCPDVAVTVGGVQQPDLDPGAVTAKDGLSGEVAGLLGVTLAAPH